MILLLELVNRARVAMCIEVMNANEELTFLLEIFFNILMMTPGFLREEYASDSSQHLFDIKEFFRIRPKFFCWQNFVVHCLKLG